MRGRIEALKGAAVGILLHRSFVPLCLLAALVVRLLFIALFDARPLSDFVWYFDKGRDIAAGSGYLVRDDGFPLWEHGKPLVQPRATAFWPVGYPAFLAAIFYATSGLVDPLWAAKIANALLYVAAIAAMVYAAHKIFSELGARVTALLLAFLPNHIAYTSLTSVEIYFVFLTTSAVALLLLYQDKRRSWIAAASGLCFGLAILTKPQSLLLAGVLVLALNWGHFRRAALVGLIVYAAALSCVLPWTYRNYRVFDGRFVLVSNNGGINLLISNMPGSWGKQGLMWNKELHTIITATDDEVVRDNAARAAFIDYASHHAGDLAAALPRKLFALYAADVDGFGWNQAGVQHQLASGVWLLMRIVSQAYYITILALALACMWSFRKSRAPNLRAGPVVLLYITAICLFFTGGPRFHFPVVPWIASYAAGLVAAWLAQRPASARSSLHSDPISSAPPPWPEPQPLTPDAPPATVPSRDA